MYNMSSNTILSNDQIRRVAPSVFAETPIDGVSDRYAFIPTSRVLDALRGEGWNVVKASQTRVRTPDNREFARHMLRLRHPSIEPVLNGDSFPEVVLLNSHNRTSGFTLQAGLFRLVCSNGMVISDGTFGKIGIRHTGADTIINDVIEGTYKVIEELPNISDKLESIASVTLNDREREAYAEAALELRWQDGNAPVTASDLLDARRREDRKPDLWHTFNTVQENLIKGGLRGRNKNGKRTRTRAVNSVNEDVRLNRALFTLTEKMAELKAA